MKPRTDEKKLTPYTIKGAGWVIQASGDTLALRRDQIGPSTAKNPYTALKLNRGTDVFEFYNGPRFVGGGMSVANAHALDAFLVGHHVVVESPDGTWQQGQIVVGPAGVATSGGFIPADTPAISLDGASEGPFVTDGVAADGTVWLRRASAASSADRRDAFAAPPPKTLGDYILDPITRHVFVERPVGRWERVELHKSLAAAV